MNPRQFASIDSSDAKLYGSLTNRPRGGQPITEPIDFAIVFEENRRLEAYQKQKGTFIQRTSASEQAIEQEKQAAVDAAFRQTVKQAKAAQEIQAQREQAQRSELLKIRSGSGTPHPYDTESERNTVRRLMGLSPIDEPPVTSAATASRQSIPSTGSPPPTLKGTAARANSLVEPTATPAPAMLKEAIATTAQNAINTLPRALPQAAGRLVIPGVGATLSIGTRLIFGQSVTQAVTSTGAGLIGSGVGAIVGTALAGPVGGIVGSMVGGTAASLFSDWLFAQNLPKGTEHLVQQEPNYPPFLGGQVTGNRYNISFTFDLLHYGKYFQSHSDSFINVRGKILRCELQNPGPGGGVGLVIYSEGFASIEVGTYTFGYYPAFQAVNLRNVKISRTDRNQDIGTDIQQPIPPPLANVPYRYDASPIGNDNTIPTGLPPSTGGKGADPNTKAVPLKRGITRNVAPSMPSNNTPNGAPFFPGHGGLAPSYLPNPTQLPDNLGGMLPAIQEIKHSLPFAEPEDLPAARPQRFGLTVTPSTGGIIPIVYADVTPATITPVTVKYAEGNDSRGNIYNSDGTITTQDGIPVSSIDANSTSGSLPSSVPIQGKAQPIPDSFSATPKKASVPIAKTTEQAATEQQKKDFDDKIGQLTAIATGLAALTPAIQGIPDAIAKSPAIKAANKETIQGAVCEIATPTGCLGAPIKKAEDAANANGTKLDALNAILSGFSAASNAAQMALLNVINGKLGEQLPGGIGGKLSRFAEWMHLDRVLNVMILAATVHNALMISNDIGQTLVGIINNVLQLIGLKKEDGSTFDIGSVISSSIENLIKGAIGTENYTSLKESWAKANRIYQASTNILNSFQGLTSTIFNGLELIASQTGKIGNALRASGEVLESAYQWMNPQPKINRITNFLEGLQNGASTIQQVTQVPLDTINAVAELQTANTEFIKALKEDDKPKNKTVALPEPDKLAAEKKAAKEASKGIELLDTHLEADD